MPIEMSQRIQKLDDQYKSKCGQFEHIRITRGEARREKIKAKEAVVNYSTVLELTKEIALRTQTNIEKELGSIVTYALDSVLDPEYKYKFKIEFVERRNQTETDILLEDKFGNIIHPKYANAGGISDIISFALQVALWAMKAKRTRNVLILDEPMRFLKGGDLPQKGANMIKAISHKLGVQIIMVSHSSTLIEASDKIFKVVQGTDGISRVKEVIEND